MKKLLMLLLALCLLLTFVACGDKDGAGDAESGPKATESETELADESILDDSESKAQVEDDDWLGEDEESESQPDRWTDHH